MCSHSTGTAAVADGIPRPTYDDTFAGQCSRWFKALEAELVFGVTSRATDETLATKLIIKRSFGVGHAANYLRAPSLLVFAACNIKVPFEPIDQTAMIECVSENWPVCATESPVQFKSLTEDRALRLRPCLQAALREDVLPSGKECRRVISNVLLSAISGSAIS